MVDKYYKKEFEEAKLRGASEEHLNRMEFLSKGKDVQKKINKWVNGVLKGDHWFFERRDRRIILHKAIQSGIQIALDINKEIKEVRNSSQS